MPAPSPIVVVAPDSFKGSLSASRAAAAMRDGILRARPDAQVRVCPLADGGEGTLDALLVRGGTRRVLRVAGAAGQPRDAAVGLFDAWEAWAGDDAGIAPVRRAALIESAEIVGLTDAAGTAVPIEVRTTRGLGEAVSALLDDGVRDFYVALGGSSTNDAGAGLLATLGLRGFDAGGAAVPLVPDQFMRVARLDTSRLDARLADTRWVALSDVDNPLTGPQGATAVFGPQKGLRPGQAAALDAALAHFAARLEASLGRSCSLRPGAGAAGGLGFALLMLGARFAPGAEAVARRIGLDTALAGAHWLLTGEGRSDGQTLRGKAPFVAARHARAAGVPASLLSGAVEGAALAPLAAYFTHGAFSIAPGPIALATAVADAARLLSDAAEQLTRLRFGNA